MYLLEASGLVFENERMWRLEMDCGGDGGEEELIYWCGVGVFIPIF